MVIDKIIITNIKSKLSKPKSNSTMLNKININFLSVTYLTNLNSILAYNSTITF